MRRGLERLRDAKRQTVDGPGDDSPQYPQHKVEACIQDSSRESFVHRDGRLRCTGCARHISMGKRSEVDGTYRLGETVNLVGRFVHK
jgi:hypothetical protein